ncbi:Radical SAM superfamily protein [anaerobic digester metagenome]
MKFSTENQDYWYEDRIALSFPGHMGMDLIDESEKTLEKKLQQRFERGEDQEFCKTYLKKWRSVFPASSDLQLMIPFDPEKVKREVLRNGLNQLTLSVTERCNLRCKYCTYSDNYSYSRGYSTDDMPYETARQAIAQYFTLVELGKRYNPYRTLSIGFYGGEPLLNFQLIKDCVEYVSATYPDYDVLFTISTNGTLLNTEVSEYLMEKGFSIAISLDGPEKEHDRNRVYANGKGTFNDVIQNIGPIIDSGYEKISSLVVFDINSDLFKIQDFFNRKDIPPVSNATMPNRYHGCTYYDRFLPEDFERFNEQITMAKEAYLSHLNEDTEKVSFFDQIFGNPSYKILAGPATLADYSAYMIPCTGTCTPGKKIYVDVHGLFYPCERVCESLTIGDCRTGLDFARISKLLDDYFSSLDYCRECKHRKLCSKCFSTLLTGTGFASSAAHCKHANKSCSENLSFAHRIGEESYNFYGRYFGRTNNQIRTLTGWGEK